MYCNKQPCCCNSQELINQAIEVVVLRNLQDYIKPLEHEINQLKEEIKLLKKTS